MARRYTSAGRARWISVAAAGIIAGMRGPSTVSMLVLAVAVGGCGGKKAPPASGGRDAGAPTPVDAAPPVDAGALDASAAAPRPAAADEVAQARSFVERWVAAQNDGDFAGYQGLYADDMRGVRRSGTQVRRFDRAGWMRDRKAMFRKPMTVTAEDIVVYAAGPLRQVFFTQTWEQGSYRDVGTKNLVLVGAGDQTRIRYEELLGSRIVAVAAPAARTGSGADWFGYDHASTFATMRLAPVTGDEAIIGATDRALPPRGLETVEAVRDPADASYRAGQIRGELPPGDPLAALAGQPVVVLDDGLTEVCRGTVGAPRLEVAGYLADGVDDEAALGAALWARERPVVVAPIVAPCRGAFVRGVDAPELTPLTDVDGLTEAKAKGQRARLSEAEVAVTWIDAVDDGRRGFALFTRARDESCDAPELHERVVYAATADGRGRWSFTEVARLEGEDGGLVVVDLDGDGALEAIVDGGVYRAGGFELWRPVLRIPWPAGLGCDGYDGD